MKPIKNIPLNLKKLRVVNSFLFSFSIIFLLLRFTIGLIPIFYNAPSMVIFLIIAVISNLLFFKWGLSKKIRMKISYRTHPALSLLESKKLNILYDVSDRQYWPILTSFFQPKFNEFVLNGDFSKIYHVSRPFYDASKLSVGKLLSQEMMLTITGETGTLLIGDLTVFYFIKRTEKDVALIEFVAFTNSTVDGSVALAAFSLPEEKTSKQTLFYSTLMPTIEYQSPALVFGHTLLNVILFKKYAEVELKLLPSQSKIKNLTCNYVNSTKLNISLLDSKWFTTLVKSDAFKVRGHFRLQPCGEGMKDRKLIWINDFQKEGYTAPAKKLSNN